VSLPSSLHDPPKAPRENALSRLLVTGLREPMPVRPRAAVALELSCRTRHDLATAALAGEAILLLEATGEHAGKPSDLRVQRLRARGIHPRIAPGRARSQRSRPHEVLREPWAAAQGSQNEILAEQRLFSYR